MKNFWKISFCFLFFLAGCSMEQGPTHTSAIANDYSQIPTPYSEVPEGQFLFVTISGNDFCPIQCGECYVLEQQAPLFEVKDGKLIIYDFYELHDIEDWNTFRSKNDLIGLRYLGKEWSIAEKWGDSLTLFEPIKELPFSGLYDIFVLQQVNNRGDIVLIIDDKLIDLEVNRDLTITVTRQDQGLSCFVSHEYTITNYGFIRDENVEIININSASP